ncbi:hypothetical protein AgCh_000159 [Apium graveolens]
MWAKGEIELSVEFSGFSRCGPVDELFAQGVGGIVELAPGSLSAGILDYELVYSKAGGSNILNGYLDNGWVGHIDDRKIAGAEEVETRLHKDFNGRNGRKIDTPRELDEYEAMTLQLTETPEADYMPDPFVFIFMSSTPITRPSQLDLSRFFSGLSMYLATTPFWPSMYFLGVRFTDFP